MDYQEIKKINNWELVCRLMILCNREGVKFYRCELDNEFAEDIELMRKEIVERMGRVRNEF